MNKKELWDNFVRTGKVSDYLKYKKANDSREFPEDLEIAQEFFPDEEELYYDDNDRWDSTP